MCLINFHYANHPHYKLIVVANRDEEYGRPSKQAHFWDDEPMILAGRDLLQMGTWLGVSKNGKFAAITNFRDPSEPPRPKSRGEIVTQFLTGNKTTLQFIEELQTKRESYGGYNVLLYDGQQFHHYNNRLDEVNKISRGTHSLSNYSLNTPWPKVVKGTNHLQQLVEQNQGEIDAEPLFNLLSDQTIAPDKDLPNTGVGLELERQLSSLFIKLPNYGTRTSTVLLINHDNSITFIERTYEKGQFQFDTKFEFSMEQR
ncbi:NRDE family protein [Lysinibacillus sp. BW-2-10]|uniref:NRDE family protein n=1 Tax=Lysinibacillus sp. BW-2-10 TaxID=2590030 RepID=UPI001180696B|nr:NRDE family protein [Lysinibacillus sp. BW-2-10]TSI05218.1 NRDE family protein [Lysinibacillus sp. BW-2-10]